MNIFEKILVVMSKNLGYSILLIASLIIFITFTDGNILAGALIALSALIGYICTVFLYKEYKKLPKVKVVKKTTGKKPASKKK